MHDGTTKWDFSFHLLFVGVRVLFLFPSICPGILYSRFHSMFIICFNLTHALPPPLILVLPVRDDDLEMAGIVIQRLG